MADEVGADWSEEGFSSPHMVANALRSAGPLISRVISKFAGNFFMSCYLVEAELGMAPSGCESRW